MFGDKNLELIQICIIFLVDIIFSFILFPSAATQCNAFSWIGNPAFHIVVGRELSWNFFVPAFSF